MARHVSGLLRAEQRSKAPPDPSTTSRLRELRMLSESLTAYRTAREDDVEGAALFFATLAQRLPNLDELASGAFPIATDPDAAR